MNTQHLHTLSIGISFDEISKKVMASLALAIACQDDGKPIPLLFDRCRLHELVILKAKDECSNICATLAGYITNLQSDDSSATIDITLPGSSSKVDAMLVASRFDQAVTESVIAAICSSSEHLAAEFEKSKTAGRHAISALKQLLAIRC